MNRVPVRTTLAFALFFTAISAFAQTATPIGGATRLTLSSEFVGAVQTLRLTPGAVVPTIISDDGGTADFPVVAGAIDLNNGKAEIIHSGGLTLTSASGTTVRLQSFTIDTVAATPVLSGLVVVNERLVGRVSLFTVQLPGTLSVPLTVNNQLLRLSGVRLRLTEQAATALNQAFGVTALQAGFTIGDATVFAYVSNSNQGAPSK